MTPKLRNSLLKFLCLISACILFAGCGSDDEAERQAEKDRGRSALNKVAGLKKRFHQLDATLTQMESEADIQKQKIAAARLELGAIQDMLASGRFRDLAGDYHSTAPLRIARASTDEVDRAAEAEAARDGVFRMLVILLFLLFAFVYLAKLWRDRHNIPSMPEEHVYEPPVYDSPEDKTPPPVS